LADIQHTHPAQSKVVFYGIIRIEFPQTLCDFDGHLPIGCYTFGKLDPSPDAGDVCIQGNDELGCFDLRPQTQIQSIVSDHPPEEQVHSLATAPIGWICQAVPCTRSFCGQGLIERCCS